MSSGSRPRRWCHSRPGLSFAAEEAVPVGPAESNGTTHLGASGQEPKMGQETRNAELAEVLTQMRVLMASQRAVETELASLSQAQRDMVSCLGGMRDDPGPFSRLSQPRAVSPAAPSSLSAAHGPSVWLGEYEEDSSPTRGEPQRAASHKLLHEIKQHWILEVADWWRNLQEPPVENPGPVYKIATSSNFLTLCMSVVIINSIWLLHCTDMQMQAAVTGERAWYAQFGDVLDWAFLSFYIIEIMIKLAARGIYFFIGDGASWNLLDLTLVLSGLLDNILGMITEGMDMNMTFLRVLRVLRVTKLLRTMKVLRSFQEMRLLIEMLTASATYLFWAMLVMVFMLMLFSVFFVQATTSFLNHTTIESMPIPPEDLEALEHAFGSVAMGMFSLLQTVTGGIDWMDAYNLISPTGTLNSVVFVAFVLFFTFSVFNIVTSVFVDKTMRLALPDLETLLHERQEDEKQAAKDLESFMKRSLCMEDDDKLHFKDFSKLMEKPRFRAYFELRGIEVKDMKMFFTMITSNTYSEDDDKCITLHDFVRGCMRLKGNASAIDLQSLAYQVRLLQQSLSPVGLIKSQDGAAACPLRLAASGRG